MSLIENVFYKGHENVNYFWQSSTVVDNIVTY